MAKTELTEPATEKTAEQAAPIVAGKERYVELLSLVQAKVAMLQNNPGSQAEFPEFVELMTYAEKVA